MTYFATGAREEYTINGDYKFTIIAGNSEPIVLIELYGDKNVSKAPPLPRMELPHDSRIKLDYCFQECKRLEHIDSLREWNLSNIISLHGMFRNCRHIQSIGAMKSWDMRSVTDMSHMFSGCWDLCIKPGSFPLWDTSKVTNMSHMFYDTDLSPAEITWLQDWNLNSVTEIHNMFGSTVAENCISLMHLPKAVSGQIIYYNKFDDYPVTPVKDTHYWIAEGEPDKVVCINEKYPELPPGIDDWFDIPV